MGELASVWPRGLVAGMQAGERRKQSERERGRIIEDGFDILFSWVSVQTATDVKVIFYCVYC
jgi:hypothetical protein